MVADHAEPHVSRGRVVPGRPRRAPRVKGDRYLRRAESNPDDSTFDRLTRETISRWMTPRWKRHRRPRRAGAPDAVVVFTVPMAHLRGVPDALRERFGVPIVFYDGDVPMSLPEFGGMDTGFNPYHGADPWEYDLVLSNSEGGIGRLLELGARRARRCTGARTRSSSRLRPSRKRSTSSSTGTATSSGATG